MASHPVRYTLHAREETLESRGIPCLFLNTERGFGGKPPKKSGFRRLLAGSKMPKEGSKMPKETFLTAISRWRVVAVVEEGPVSGSGAAGTSNSTNVRLTRWKFTLCQWLAVLLWVSR